MFEFVRNNNRLFQFLLLLVILPGFVLVGIQGYTSLMSDANATVATVNGRKIAQAEWDAAVHNQAERIRNSQPTIDPKQLDTPEFKYRVLEDLVRQRVLQEAVTDERLGVDDGRILSLFRNDEQWQFMRNPDGSINKQVLAAQGLTSRGFIERLRQEISQRQVIDGVIATVPTTATNANLAFDAVLQQRSVQLQAFDPKSFEADIKPSDAEVEAFYKDSANAKQFAVPEHADIQYVMLDLDAFKAGVKVNEDELQAYYKENSARYTVAEERRASHILIKVDKSASAADRAKAKAKADELLAEVRKNPAQFADIARKNSQDEGSAANGGDLDWFGHGAMVKPFENAVYALKQGEISNVVESDFGYHIIQLTGIRGGDKKPFEQVRPQIEEELRKQLAEKRFAEEAEGFTNMVYEQSDSLQPVVDKYKLQLLTATVTRKPTPMSSGPLASTKLLDAVFSDDVLTKKHNTAAIEAGPNQLVAARIVAYHAAAVQPLDQVRDRVRAQLVHKLAVEQAAKAGAARLAALQKPDADLAGLSDAQLVSRAKPGNLPAKVLEAIMAADASKLPATLGTDAGDGSYIVARIEKIVPRDPAVPNPKVVVQQYARAWSQAEGEAYYQALKARYKVVIKAVKPVAAAASAAAQ
ncbi:MAG: peptidylprolyl isomerase [Paucibacter sp.]|nr:peptidylprolyl isomerase [Roseateles sp.]